ncbi:MAG: LssY C-terminal domain-containing protein [Verrucomicrobiota bacterium]
MPPPPPESLTSSPRCPAFPGRAALAGLCLLLLGACASPAGRSGPAAGAVLASADRIQTQAIDGVTVSADLLPDDEARRHYGVNLASKGLQAVWLRVVNHTPDQNWLLTANMDPEYFTADEAAYLFRGGWGRLGLERTQQRFRDLAMRSRLAPGGTYEGHILLPRSAGGRFVQVTINGNGRERRFGFPLRTPDGHFDFEKMDPAKIYAGEKRPGLTRSQLRQRLEELPATATNATGSAAGDPLNIVLVGESAQIMAALSECGWSFTHRIDGTTVRHMISAALRGKPYLTAPVSSLYLFGRKQDLAFQRSRQNIAQRNHMRLWLAPYTFEGSPVWVGQVSRDIGMKLTRKSSTLTTHVIDPMVDEARQYLLESLLFRYRVGTFGFVRAFAPAPPGHPRTNLTGDPYITDGLRLITVISSHPVPAEKVRNLGWAKTEKGPIEFGQSGADRPAPRDP